MAVQLRNIAPSERTTRLAPSPTGALHLGNAFAFVMAWIIARQRGWRVVLRIDDLDGPRIKQGAAAAALRTLQWLGLDWDAGPQSESQWLDAYRERLRALASLGAIFPCRCTRSQIQAAAMSAPHGDAHELRYPGTCRPPGVEPVEFEDMRHAGAAWRFRLNEPVVEFVDEIQGAQVIHVAAQVGDFLVANKERQPTYQLAVVIDDEIQGVTDVVRGADLVASTGRQILIQRALGLPARRYWHTPLIVGPDGLRLAKRHGDTRVDYYAERGVLPEYILGLIGHWAGVTATRTALTLAELQASFSVSALPRTPIVFSDVDHDWLLTSTR